MLKFILLISPQVNIAKSTTLISCIAKRILLKCYIANIKQYIVNRLDIAKRIAIYC